jgi:hypothetical protein
MRKAGGCWEAYVADVIPYVCEVCGAKATICPGDLRPAVDHICPSCDSKRKDRDGERWGDPAPAVKPSAWTVTRISVSGNEPPAPVTVDEAIGHLEPHAYHKGMVEYLMTGRREFSLPTLCYDYKFTPPEAKKEGA